MANLYRNNSYNYGLLYRANLCYIIRHIRRGAQMSEQKSCGTCKWFMRLDRTTIYQTNTLGTCACPVPESVGRILKATMVENSGASCECWENKT